jgi:3-dehydroquinate synthase
MTTFNFDGAPQDIRITGPVPSLQNILEELEALPGAPVVGAVLLICDENTLPLARLIVPGENQPLCVLKAGESHKDWAAVESIIRAAAGAGIGRDGLFIACGGGVVSDLVGFAASIYMRGLCFCTVSTTLLGMVDAAMGGKTGFDLLGIKNLAGTFYPARLVYLPTDSLSTLPPTEWKSGMAELIKTAVLDGDEFFRLLEQDAGEAWLAGSSRANRGLLAEALSRAVAYKGRIVEEDPRERGGRRALLNLGHSFGHALESSAGLGRISHGEAVAWGMARACELGQTLGITPAKRAERIISLLKRCGYETAAPHRLMGNINDFMAALGKDKKKKGGKSVFIIPNAQSAEILREPPTEDLLLYLIQGAR